VVARDLFPSWAIGSTPFISFQGGVQPSCWPIALPGVITGGSLLLFYMLIGIKRALNTIIWSGTGLMS